MNMGIFNFFKKKRTINVTEVRNKFFHNKETLWDDANKLREITKFDVSIDTLAGLMIRCACYLEFKTGWTNQVLYVLRNDCEGKISDIDLKWLMVYMNLHYLHKDNMKELALLMEIGGRQIGMPSPTGNISTDYKF